MVKPNLNGNYCCSKDVTINIKKICSRSRECNASLCPEANNPEAVWYPDEPICRCRKYFSLNWIRRQRKIARKTVYRDLYFTKDDLERIRRVTNKIKGQNPDIDMGSDITKKYRLNPMTPYLRRLRVTTYPSNHTITQPITSNHSKPPVRQDTKNIKNGTIT